VKADRGLTGHRLSRPDHALLPRLGRYLLMPLRRLPERLRDRRFWNTQLMVLAATLPHYVVETAGFTNPLATLHGLVITLYVFPLLYAALSFGWEGAILTGLWATLLTTPSMWIWHSSGYEWLTESGQLAITLPAGIMVAWRVDLESNQRRRAERTSVGLSLLNEIGEQLSHQIEVEQELPAVVARLARGLRVEADRGRSVIVEPRNERTSDIPVDELDRLAAERREPVVLDDHLICVPLGAEGAIGGSLGMAVPPGGGIIDEQTRLLAAVAHTIRVAVENARLYRQRQESLQSYARQVTQAQEDERLRIARDLHDETAQELVHLARRLEQLGERVPADVVPRVDDLVTLTRATLKSVRRFSRDLRPSVLDDLGLVPALELAVGETKATLSGGARLEIKGEPRRLAPAVELALFRIAQQALHNVEKHAHATSVVVELAFEDGAVRLRVEDDGSGWVPPANLADLPHVGKLGVLGMKERAQLIGGTFELSSSPGQGSRITVVAAQEPD
jgi:signal transduction histidine kinase